MLADVWVTEFRVGRSQGLYFDFAVKTLDYLGEVEKGHGFLRALNKYSLNNDLYQRPF